MRKSTVSLLTWMALVSLGVGTAYAKSPPEEKGKVYEYKQELEGVVAGKSLPPGIYNVKITYDKGQNGTLTIIKNKQTVAEAPCQIEKANLNLGANSVAYGRNGQGERVLRWLFLSNRGEKVVLAGEEQQAQGGK